MDAYATGADTALGLLGYDLMDRAFCAAMFDVMPWLALV